VQLPLSQPPLKETVLHQPCNAFSIHQVADSTVTASPMQRSVGGSNTVFPYPALHLQQETQFAVAQPQK
jgi:hypothetical protein